MRVIHLISKLDPGGIEKWLIDLQKIDSKNEHHILCISGKEGVWHNKALNTEVYPNLLNGKVSFIYQLREFIKKSDFDIVHLHLYQFSAILAASLIGITKKIVCHSHNDKSLVYSNEKKFFYKLRKYFFQKMFNFLDTKNIAVSKNAGNELFGSNNYSIIRCGLFFDFNKEKIVPFKKNKKIKLITVGSLTHQKNHSFIIKLLKNKKLENVQLDIVGDGKLRNELYELISNLNLHNRVKLLGIVDQPLSIFVDYDKFIFPSLYEGLGLAYIEAQYIGMPCLVSDVIPIEADVVKGNIKRISLSSESDWINEILNFKSEYSSRYSMNLVLDSDFNIVNANEALNSFYKKI